MHKFVKALITGFVVLSLNSVALAADTGSLDDAVAMVKKAKAYLIANGPDKSFPEFNNPKGKFVDRDIYIYVYEKSGKNVAHGGNPKLIGKNLIDMRDTDGQYIIRGLLEVANKGGGTFPYKFLNPTTGEVEPKVGYVEMTGDYMVGSGVYKK